MFTTAKKTESKSLGPKQLFGSINYSFGITIYRMDLMTNLSKYTHSSGARVDMMVYDWYILIFGRTIFVD